MLKRIKLQFCRHRHQYPRRVGTHTLWQCARCDLYTAPIHRTYYH